jgi:NAD(P)-dependent dehydrogenase (short-subunit alcohol dehydrogenase family)
MVQTALVTGADRGLGLALSAGLLYLGWRVFAGQFMPDWPELTALAQRHPDQLACIALDVSDDDSVRAAAQAVSASTDHLDLLINNAGILAPSGRRDTIRESQDYSQIQRMINVNALGPVRVVEAFLPLMDAGKFKRLCFVSSEAGSVGASKRTGWLGYCMSKAALNMAVKNLHNELYAEGYTFRLYHPGWMRTYMSGVKNTRADLEPEEAAESALPFFLEDREDEGRLALMDNAGREWPF